MIELTAIEIAHITQGRLVGSATAGASILVTSATTDSRESVAGTLFIAKGGEVSDGHLFVAAAFNAGAVLALVEQEVMDPDGNSYPAVQVQDTVLAMGALAAEIVRRLRTHSELTVIGVTGSFGKTTTKDLLYGLLAPEGITTAPIGSYNGEVGVPLTVFTAEYGTRYLIIEMGATGVGHIRYLANMVVPDIGIVLGVGSAHTGEFGGVENIVLAKGELLEALATSGRAIINADDPRVLGMEGRTRAHKLYFTAREDFSRQDGETLLATGMHTDDDGHPIFELRFPNSTTHEVRSRLIGSHHSSNLLAAAAAAYAVGVSPAAIASRLSTLEAESRWRMERTERPDGITVINDAYNANPESMRAALRTLAELARGRRTWAVLGEMLELGDQSIHEHDAIGRIVVRLNISRLVVVGRGAKALHTAAVLEGSWGDEAAFVETEAQAEEMLLAELVPGDLVLFKSSNATGLRHLGDRIALRTELEPKSGSRTATRTGMEGSAQL